MKNIVIGTAGHIDHGKTTLIKALTGRNTDRWKEEQERGITIDLGFTYFDLPGGQRAGIVDVPGHERFIHNMVAGVVGMDMVLLVIAADEGIMPQTREHMDILNLLGIEKSILVLNKCDMVDEDWVEMIEEEIREELAGTFLEEAPLVKVSSVTGEGIPQLVEEMAKMAQKEVVPKDIHTIPRLPVDRIFTMQGFGTIVTGTLVSGTLSCDDTVEVYPLQKTCKVRGLQVHGKDCKTAEAGQRVAVNLSNVKKRELRRGCVLSAEDSMKNTTLLDVKLEILESSNRVVTNRMRLHFFTGTSEILCRAILLDKEEIGPGESGYAQLQLEGETAVRRGDKFVVRFYSPMETIGGGEILEPNPRPRRRFREDVLEELKRKESGSSMDVVELHVKAHGDTLISFSELAKLTALSKEEIQKDVGLLQESGLVSVYAMKKDAFVWHREAEQEALRLLVKKLEEYEKRHIYRSGIKKAEIQTALFKKIRPNVFSLIVEQWRTSGKISQHGEFLSTAGFAPAEDEARASTSEIILQSFRQQGYDFGRFSEISCPAVSPEEKEDILNLLREEGLVTKLGDDLYTLTELMEAAAEKIRGLLEKEDIISIGTVRDTFATSRKCTKLILEYTDSIRLTRNAGAESEWKAY